MEESCKMNDRIRPFRFLFVWFIAGIAVWPAAAVLSVTAFVVFMSVWVDGEYWWDDNIYLIIGIALLITGFCIGTLQKWVVRKHLGVEIRRLSLSAALGALLAGIVFYHLVELLDLLELLNRYGAYGGTCCRQFNLSPRIDYTLAMAAFAGILSTVQTVTLRRYFRETWRWVAAHLGAIALQFVIVLAGRLAFPTPYDSGDIQVLLAVPIASLLTGMVMLRFCRHHLRADKAKPGKRAVQPAPVAADPPATPSVWDDAV